VTNIGTRPTFEPQAAPIRLETHLLDFHQDLYGRTISIEFVDRLRDEQRFSSVDELIDQIRTDIQKARGTLTP
jgi:riboflavin kinase/FMN adenylyltransferase